ADDKALATQIKSQMFSNPQLNGANLEVTSQNGQVTVSGTVPSDAARYEAYKIANETAGVTKVNDRMTVAAAVVTPPAPVAVLRSTSEPETPQISSPAAAPPIAEKPRKQRAKGSPKPPSEAEPAEADNATPPVLEQSEAPPAAVAQPAAVA